MRLFSLLLICGGVVIGARSDAAPGYNGQNGREIPPPTPNSQKTDLEPVKSPPTSLIGFIKSLGQYLQLIEGNEPEIKGVLCMFKYLKLYKLFGFPDHFEPSFKGFYQLMFGQTENPSSSSASSSLGKNGKKGRPTLAKLSPWFCTKLYLIYFAVRTLKTYAYEDSNDEEVDNFQK